MGIYGQGRFMLVLGVDPGREKVGWALVNQEGSLSLSGICPVSERELFLTVLTQGADSWKDGLLRWATEKAEVCFSRQEKLFLIAVGNGTGSRETVKLFERLGVQLTVVDESGTTLEARALYWSLHAPSWWQSCLPRVLWFPPRPLDDLAAWIIARRSLEIYKLKPSVPLEGKHGAGRE